MGAVKGKGNKTTERRLRSALARAGVSGWRLHPPDIFGRPDFFFSAEQLAVFVDGCFWHGCTRCSHAFKTNSAFWNAKISRNRERDAQTAAKLAASGVRVLRLWEHELMEDLPGCIGKVLRLVSRQDKGKKGKGAAYSSM
jgi:DNA mismatch endonuclease Vsr